MSTRTIKIGNMCCGRCIMVVKQVLAQNGIRHKKVELGSALIYENEQVDEVKLEKELKKSGFELIRTKEEEICEKTKIAIHKIFFDSTIDLASFYLKDYLAAQVGMPYQKVSEVFAKCTKTTVEKYFINHRIEKVKALIEDTDHSFTEIAFKLGYNSLSHLSRQFRVFTGVSMLDYKQKKLKSRKPIDRL